MSKLFTLYFAQLYRRPALSLAWIAAILYCSWPLGYILNPFVGSHDLASQLEAPHQPYNWLFIIMDVLAGLTITIVATLQINRRSHSLIKWCIVSYSVFGILVAVAALTPLNCNVAANTCGPVLDNPQLLIHGGASIVSVAFLFISTLAIGASAYRENIRAVKWAIAIVIIAWLAFGCGSFLELRWHDTGNGLQEFFITVCSISVVMVIGVIEYLHAREPSAVAVENKQ